MPKTATLFDRPLSHREDPQTSYDAADKMIKSGALSRQEDKIWVVLLGYRVFTKMTLGRDDFTPKELARNTKLDYHTIQRRFSGLNNKGKIERISINKNGKPPWVKRGGCCVWRLI